MYNSRKPAARSPTNSPTDSLRDTAESRSGGGTYQRQSSLPEDEENEYEPATYNADDSPGETEPVAPKRAEDPYISALRHRFPSRPPGDYSYTKPAGSTIPVAPPLPTTLPRSSNGATGRRRDSYESTARPAGGRLNGVPVTEDGKIVLPTLRPVDPDQKNRYAARLRGDTSATSTQTRPGTSGPGVRLNGASTYPKRPSPIATQTSREPRPTGGAFDDGIRRDRSTSFLSGNNSPQFQRCVQECLERERNRTGFSTQTSPQHFSPAVSAYDYDHDLYSGTTHRSIHSPGRPQVIDYGRQLAPTLLLDDIRHINLALSKSGISLFPYERFQQYGYPTMSPVLSSNTFNQYSPVPSSGRRIIGEVVSACRLVEEEQPAWMPNRGGSHAVENVWRAIQQHQPFTHMDSTRPSVTFRDPYDI